MVNKIRIIYLKTRIQKSIDPGWRTTKTMQSIRQQLKELLLPKMKGHEKLQNLEEKKAITED